MKNIQHLSFIFVALSFSGCASITGSTSQPISLQTKSIDGKEVKEAQCDITNKRGTYFTSTPGTLTISRSNDDLQITCRKEGYESGRAAVVSNTKGSMFGNILLGGGIGAIVDHNNGSAYEYPSFVQVIMGETITVGKKKESVAKTGNQITGSQSFSQQDVSPNDNNQQIYGNKTVSQKLEELKKLSDEGLISQEVYEYRQKAILEASN